MAVTDALGYSTKLMLRHPSVILPSLVTIFLVSVVIDSLVAALFSTLLLRSAYLLYAIDLVISVVIGIFLSGFYVGVVRHHVRGKYSLFEAGKDLNKYKIGLGWVNAIPLAIYAVLFGGAFYALYIGYYLFGLWTATFFLFAVVAVVLALAGLYVVMLFYMINLVLMEERHSGIDVLKRSAAIATQGNRLAILTAMIVVGALYFGIQFIFGYLSHDFSGLEYYAFVYISLIPDAIVTTLFDLMPPAMYFNHVMRRRQSGKGRAGL